MNIRRTVVALFFSFLPAGLLAAGTIYQPTSVRPPGVAREFRGLWIATVANIDWPSRPGLPVAQQKAELIALLDRAVQLRLNAVIFQVRPAGDAFYASAYEPWSEYLTGVQGRAPEPFYDPLAFALAEAHRRGLELHAWFNPFRARDFKSRSPAAATHLSRTHPEWVRHYGNQLWLDPGIPAARDYVRRVVLDVVRRYDVDGVQFDDYFYPYPERDSRGRELDFPDEAGWREYGLATGLTRDQWRRQNINQFIHDIYQDIKAVKPWVKFGVSPFGIWRPGNPPSVRGFDAYAKLYADSRQWLANGWLDYLSPQLYWPIGAPQQSFSALLDWWTRQNVKGRHLWPGLDAVKASQWPPEEIPNQIRLIRQAGDSGEIFWNASNLVHNAALDEKLRREIYLQPALVPASPWLEPPPSQAPKLTANAEGPFRWTARWEPAAGQVVRQWVLQFRQANGTWTTEILPADQLALTSETVPPEIICVRAVDRAGNLSPPAALQKIALANNAVNSR